MEEEWIRWMRENAPARLYEEMQGSVAWAAKWRDNLISNYTKALTDYINETGVGSTLLPDVVPPEKGTLTAKLERVTNALRALVKLKEHKDAHGKTPRYTNEQPKAWEEARNALKEVLHDKDHDVAEHVYDDNQCQPSDPDEQPSAE